MTDAEMLDWVADRLVHQYGESEYVDFVVRLRRIALRLAVLDNTMGIIFSKRGAHEDSAAWGRNPIGEQP